MDCDVPVPCTDDIMEEIASIPPERMSEFVPYDPKELAHSWVMLVKISISLGAILETHYRPGISSPSVRDIEECAKKIEQHSLDTPDVEQTSSVMQLYKYQLQLFHE